jgi:hypothetical protein
LAPAGYQIAKKLTAGDCNNCGGENRVKMTVVASGFVPKIKREGESVSRPTGVMGSTIGNRSAKAAMVVYRQCPLIVSGGTAMTMPAFLKMCRMIVDGVAPGGAFRGKTVDNAFCQSCPTAAKVDDYYRLISSNKKMGALLLSGLHPPVRIIKRFSKSVAGDTSTRFDKGYAQAVKYARKVETSYGQEER